MILKRELKEHFRNPVFLDIEASSLGPQSYPVEIGFIDTTGFFDSFLINPYHVHYWTDWDPNAQFIHGLSRERLREEGIDPLAAAERLNALLKDQLVISDAAQFDQFWIDSLFEATPFEPFFRIIDQREWLFCFPAEQQMAYWDHRKHEPNVHRSIGDSLRMLRPAIKAGLVEYTGETGFLTMKDI